MHNVDQPSSSLCSKSVMLCLFLDFAAPSISDAMILQVANITHLAQVAANTHLSRIKVYNFS